MVPTWGWPDENEGDADDPAKKSRLNPAVPPDWRWRVKALVDERKDSDRPKPAQPLAIDVAAIDALLTTSETNPVAGQAAQAYLLLAARHQDALEKTKNSRQILFRSNFGLVRFEHDGTKLVAVHELISAFLDPTEALPQAALVPATYMLHKAVLGPEDEAPPDTLREVAIEAPPMRPHRRRRNPRLHRPEGARAMADTSFFKKLAREVVRFFDFLANVLGEELARKALVSDLGGDPTKPAPFTFPPAALDSIRTYVDSTDTSAEAEAAMLHDVAAADRCLRLELRGMAGRAVSPAPSSRSIPCWISLPAITCGCDCRACS